MIPIPEYYMRSAVPVGGGERVTGYYIRNRTVDGKDLQHIIFNPDKHADGWYSIEIDPDTLEPVRVRPIIETEDENGIPYEFIHYRCPNCRQIFTQECKGQKENLYRPKYHSECGMALQWEDDSN